MNALYSLLTLLESSAVIVGGSDAAAAVAESAAPVAGEAAAGGLFAGFGGAGILIYVVVLGGLYMLLIRPQRKREKEIKQMQETITVGENVLTSSGMYGVVTAIGEDCFIVEFGTNKGVRIPIRKVDIIGIKTPNIMPGSIVTEK